MRLIWCFLLGILLVCFSASAVGHNISTEEALDAANNTAAKGPSRAQGFTMSLLDAKGNGAVNLAYTIDAASVLGNYAVTSTATIGTTSGSATTSFIVK